MKQYIDKSALVAEIERRIVDNKKDIERASHKNLEDYFEGYEDALTLFKEQFLDTLEVKEVEEEPISEDLEESANNYVGHAPEIDEDLSCFTKRNAFIAGAQWRKANLWKDAQGDDLPEIDREVIALLDNGTVVFAHRPPERWYGRNMDGEEHIFEPKTYDKGGWNIPDVKFWLDCNLPNLEQL